MRLRSNEQAPSRPGVTGWRRGWALLTGLTLVAGLALVGAQSAPRTAEVEPAFVNTCIGYCKHPTNAAKVFRWGREAWRQEFEKGGLSKHWKSNKRALVTTQVGMLTINARSRSGVVKVWPDNQASRYGRWEARVRAREFESTGRKYSFVWELVPAKRSQRRCGQGIVMASYRTGDAAAKGAVRAHRKAKFAFTKKRDLRSRAWHTYAVEVTPGHISWFVDTKVVHTERRDAALTGIKFRPQFRIQGVKGADMRKSWMQMDWARHYDLARPNAKSIKAPQMRRQTYAARC